MDFVRNLIKLVDATKATKPCIEHSATGDIDDNDSDISVSDDENSEYSYEDLSE